MDKKEIRTGFQKRKHIIPFMRLTHKIFCTILRCALREEMLWPQREFTLIQSLILFTLIISGDMKTPRNNEDVQMITFKLMAIHFSFFFFFFLF